MRRPGCDEDNLAMSDVLCDFCESIWTEELPMVEGHHGSCICGRCLTIAYTEVALHDLNAAPAGYKCTLCLEERPDAAWASPSARGRLHLPPMYQAVRRSPQQGPREWLEKARRLICVIGERDPGRAEGAAPAERPPTPDVCFAQRATRAVLWAP
ncbi:MAG: hypothetical protein IPJ41_02535 [Phycisphaerales bacterium]|nr:hypothetical protein [Phycisphaerales bacterium]